MSKPALGTIVSVALNLVLSLWLINNYFYDEPFRNYVNITLGQIYPFLIVSIGVGGGSGLGYVLLKRRHPDQSIASRLQQARPLRQGPSGGGTMSQGRGLASIASSAQGTRHTAYAVPPLPKSPFPTGQRSTPTLSWTAGPKPSTAGPPGPHRPETHSATPSFLTVPQGLKVEGSSSLPHTSRPDQSPPSVTRIPPEPSSRLTSTAQWRPETGTAGERRFEPGAPFAKPGLDISAKPGSTSSIPPPGPGGQRPPAFQPSKWQPPDSASGKPPQWVDPVPKQGYSPAPKWVPPSGAGPGAQPPPGGPVQRPGPFGPPRSPFAQTQPPPRPLAYPGAMRPPEGGGPQGQRPFRPDLARPIPGGIPPPRPPVQGPRPVPQPGPQQYTPQAGGRPKPPLTGTLERPTTTGPGNEVSTPATMEPPPSSVPPAGEMDWDTALDTILKTLRKDKLGEK